MNDQCDQQVDPPTMATSPESRGIPVARPIAVPAHQASPPRDEMLLPRSTAGQAWADLLLASVLILATSLTIEGALWSVATGPLGEDAAVLENGGQGLVQRAILVPMLLLRAFATLLIVALVVRRRGQGCASLGLTKAHLGLNLALGVVVAVVAFVLTIGVMVTLSAIWPAINKQMLQNAERIMTLIPPFHPLVFLPLAIVIATYEEVVFRGFLMTRLRRGTGSWTLGLLISTAVFTVLHAADQTRSALIAITILSVVFGASTIWWRSLVPPIVAHTIWNLSQFVFLYYAAGETWQ